jgi:hypothetical protein
MKYRCSHQLSLGKIMRVGFLDWANAVNAVNKHNSVAVDLIIVDFMVK